MTKKIHDTPLLDELKSGPWPSFVEGLERLATDEEKPGADMMKDLLGQLEHSYEERRGFWKGGTVSVFGYDHPSSTRCASSHRQVCIIQPSCCAICATSGKSTAQA